MSTTRSSANLFSHRHNTDYNSSANYTSTSSSPRRPYYKLGGSSGMEDTDGEDEKKLLSLSDRIKKLSSSKILRDNSTLTHNNNEPFTYLKKSKAEPPPLSSSFGQGYSSTLSRDPSLSNKPKREVIYAQVVVDDDKTTKDFLTNGNHSSGTTKSKRTIHRSYNNNDYKQNSSSSASNNYRGATTTTTTGASHLNNNNTSSSSSNKMRGRNVTTVLLNSSSDDINELSYRDKYSSSPVLFSQDNHDASSYYPKSPAIVMRAANFQSSNRRYEDVGRQYKSAYHASEDDDEYFRRPKYSDDDEQYRFDKKSSYNRYENSYQPMKFTSEDSSKRRSFAMSHENSYNKQDTTRRSHSHINSSSRPKFDDYNDNNNRPFGVYDENDEDDPLDQNYNPNFNRFGTLQSSSVARKSKTLERDHSFNNKSRLLDTGGGSADHYSSRSRTLDDRLGNKKAGSRTRLIGDTVNDEEEERKFQVLISNKKETKKSGGVFSTLLRRNPNKGKGTEGGKVPKESATKASKSELSTDNKSNGGTSGSNKKGGQSTNFFTSFLEKKRKKQSTNKSTNGNAKSSTISSTTATVGSKKEKSQKDNTSSTYQSYSQNWPPPTLTVTDYSDSSPNKGNSFYDREHAVDSNTEQDSVMGSNDIWKKSYGNLATDNAKVKRRWTVRESSKPSVIREEPEPRSLDRNKSFLGGSSTTPRQGYQSIDRRPKKSLPPSDDQTDGYNSFEISKSFRDSISPPKSNKYNTLETHRYSPEKTTSSLGQMKYGGDFDDNKIPTTTTSPRTPIGGSYNRMDKQSTLSRGRKAHKGYAYGGGTPNSSGSESNPRNNTNVLGNGSLRSVYLHEAAIIPEMPRTNTASPGGAPPSLSGLSGRRTLSKDEISNYSGPRKETKQLSRSMSVVAPWGPTKHYKDKYKELDYSRSNTNLHLPPRPPSRSPSYSRGGSNERALIGNKSVSTKNIQKSKQDAIRGSKQPGGGVKGSKKNFNSSVESLLRQDTPPDSIPNKKGTSKLSRSKSMVAPPGYDGGPRDGKSNRFSTLWFSKKNQK